MQTIFPLFAIEYDDDDDDDDDVLAVFDLLRLRRRPLDVLLVSSDRHLECDLLRRVGRDLLREPERDLRDLSLERDRSLLDLVSLLRECDRRRPTSCRRGLCVFSLLFLT